MIRVDEADPIGEVELSFPYREVVIKRNVDAKEFYDMHTEIGRGKFGTVYRCREKQSNLELAAKFIPVGRKEDRRNVEREVDIMRKLQHPRLIQLYDAFDCGKIMVVVLELIEGGELFERVIDDDFVLTEKSCTAFMRQICEGIEYVHRQNILHLDMKPENILCLTKTGNRIKIIDFGLARKFDPDKKLQVLFGTPEFVAPEVVNFDQIGFGTDMWSVGVICYVLLSGLSPFMGETDVETMANVTIAKYDFDDEAFEDISHDAKDFITKLLLKDKRQRMTATECLEHSWLRRKPPAAPFTPATPTPLTSGLDVAKDNLRMFVERWTEHPNSPYMFDVSAHVISPLMLAAGLQLTSSQHSLRGMSPSPCGSLNSSPDSIIELPVSATPPDDHTFNHYTFNPPPITHINHHNHNNHNHVDHLQSFERRASDSSFVVRKQDIAERINLAEEIRKLSDKLFKMSTLSDFNAITTNGTESTAKSTPTTNYRPIPIKTQTQTKQSDPQQLNAPWRRTKFRMTGMNRDVPLNSYSKSSCFTAESENNTQVSTKKWATSMSNANSAVGTKDLLLKLLDKWDDAHEPVRTATGRHKSISTEWSEVESVGQRTISSLNTFFQSRATNKKAHPFMQTNGVK